MSPLEINKLPDNLVQDIKQIILCAREKTYVLINNIMVDAYWQIGERIIKQEQGGNERAEYGKRTLALLADELSIEFEKGFDERELRRMRQFYLLFPIRETVSPELTWSHFIEIIRVNNSDARNYYIVESITNHWSVRQLRRNISTLYYDRLLLSPDKQAVIEEMKEKSLPSLTDKKHILKDPFILEFTGIDTNKAYKESELEQALINNLQKFLLELGKGFAFVDRQKMIRTEGDNPSIGILLCTETDKTIAKYSVLKDSEQLFASKYKLFLPSEEELRAEIEREKEYYQSINH